jgi:[protein-PII] uridylyltransferase
VLLDTGDASTALAERRRTSIELFRAQRRRSSFPRFPRTARHWWRWAATAAATCFPYSDVDLLLLFRIRASLAAGRKDAISAFLQQLWDSGLRVSHSVRTLEECLEVHDQNTELNISLLDQRYLAGDRALYAELAAKLPRFVLANRDALARNLAGLRANATPSSATPSTIWSPTSRKLPAVCAIFSCPAGWSNCGTPKPAAGPCRASGGAGAGLPPPGALRFLHSAGGRDNNVLSFEAQDAIAEQWRLRHGRLDARIFPPRPRHLSRRHAPAGRSPRRKQRPLRQFRDWRSRLGNADFSVHRERVHVRAPQSLDADPGVVLRLFEFVARHGMRPPPKPSSRSPRAAAPARHFARRSRCGAPWKPMLSLPHAPLAVRSMHETGVLTAGCFPSSSPSSAW